MSQKKEEKEEKKGKKGGGCSYFECGRSERLREKGINERRISEME